MACKVDGVRGDLHFEVKALHPHELTGPLEAVLIATKSQHTLEALESVLPLFGPETFVVSYQNGFNEHDIAARLTEAGLGGLERVIGSIPNYGGALVDPGYLEFVHEGAIQLGEMTGEPHAAPAGNWPTMLSALTEVQLSGQHLGPDLGQGGL